MYIYIHTCIHNIKLSYACPINLRAIDKRIYAPYLFSYLFRHLFEISRLEAWMSVYCRVFISHYHGITPRQTAPLFPPLITIRL